VVIRVLPEISTVTGVRVVLAIDKAKVLIAVFVALLLFSGCTQVVYPTKWASFTFDLAGPVTGDTSPGFGDTNIFRNLRVPVTITVVGGELPLEVHNPKFTGRTRAENQTRNSPIRTTVDEDFEGGCEHHRNLYSGNTVTCVIQFSFSGQPAEPGIFPFTVRLDSDEITVRLSDLQLP
jgi:hypothetical protein